VRGRLIRLVDERDRVDAREKKREKKRKRKDKERLVCFVLLFFFLALLLILVCVENRCKRLQEEEEGPCHEQSWTTTTMVMFHQNLIFQKMTNLKDNKLNNNALVGLLRNSELTMVLVRVRVMMRLWHSSCLEEEDNRIWEFFIFDYDQSFTFFSLYCHL